MSLSIKIPPLIPLILCCSLLISCQEVEESTKVSFQSDPLKIEQITPETRYAIPGHGQRGGPELLARTFELFQSVPDQYYLFFLHNRFLETHSLDEAHSRYGKVEYLEMLDKFRQAGIQVISEQRNGTVDAVTYARGIQSQIDSLLKIGIAPANITVLGTSKGGYIAQYVSTFMENPNLNFIFIGSVQETDVTNFPEINFCGNILNIDEKSDTYFTSARARVETSKLQVKAYKELSLDTGLEHGFLFKALDEWITPSIAWAKGIR